MMGMIGVLIIVVPAPSAKVRVSNKVGVTNSKRVSIPNVVDTITMYAQATRSILRLSNISEIAPDGKAKRKIGRVDAVVIRETNSGFGASETINHEDPTSYMDAPI
jgi:hypothetical protein